MRNEVAQCQKDNQAKSEFFSMVVHQLRTPLSGTKWIFKMLLDGDLGSFSEEQRQIITKGSESNQRMIDLLNEVIIANQNQSWDFSYDMEKIDIIQLVQRLVAEYSATAKAHNVRLVFKCPAELSAMIQADPGKIAIIMQNLLENAIKYSHNDSEVIIAIEQSQDMVTISIADQGIGIPDNAQKYIFTKFFRADNAKKLKKEGTGLGLFTARCIAQKHGGTLTFKSEAGKGTVFYVQLPIHTS